MSRPKKKKSIHIDIDFTLRRVFGKPTFRPRQRDIIAAALRGHDVFVQAATSFGKSLCFQLPAVIDHGITIVVSPLLALMHNQVASLKAAGIPVATINSNTPPSDRSSIFDDLRCGHPHTRLLYVTPETCQQESFRRHLALIYSQNELARIAIDEAHCISEWGHDFRPAYSHLSHFRSAYPSTPIICLTATATPAVQQDIISTLALNPHNLKIFNTTSSRPNIHLEIRFYSDQSDSRFANFLSWLQAIHTRRSSDPSRKAELAAKSERFDAVSGIIYTTFRTECDNLASRLRLHNIGAAPYHAGLDKQTREEYQRKWIANEVGFDIIVATTAFGMGIDKQDVRFVVHWSLPKSFEGYYQEAGRAGRDGKAAACVLFYAREDRDRMTGRIARDMGGNGNGKGSATKGEGRVKSFKQLVEYCEGVERCRHAFIHEYFAAGPMPGTEVEGSGCDFACDWCKDAKGLRKRKDEGLASEEWIATQEMDPYGDWGPEGR